MKKLIKISLILALSTTSLINVVFAKDDKVAVSEQRQEEVSTRTLWGLNLSPYAREVFITLKEKGVKFNHEKIPPKKIIDATGGTVPECFAKISPEGKIPAYEETTVSGKHHSMVESLDIMNYIEKTTRGKSLRSDKEDTNKTITDFMNYGNLTIAPITHGLLMQRVVLPTFFKQATDENIVKENINKLPAVLDKLEKDLSDNREWIAKTKDISLADIAVVTHLATLENVNIDLMKEVNSKKRPHLAKYLNKVLARPSFKEAMAEVNQTLKGN